MLQTQTVTNHVINVFTLLKHLGELTVLAEQHEPDTSAINETKIDTDIDDHEILIDGYHVERHF